jgi:hypothetical protein
MFQPTTSIEFQMKTGGTFPVKAEVLGEWAVTPCVCGLCAIPGDLFTVTHVKTTRAARMHLSLATARKLAQLCEDRFPKFRSPHSLMLRSKKRRLFLLNCGVSQRRRISRPYAAFSPERSSTADKGFDI